jgi:hypothetical protein
MRHLVWYAVAGAALSWMHAKCTKYSRFSPLPRMRGLNVQRLDLPPFLPPEEEGRWAGGLGINGGKTMERTDPAKMMAALSLNNKGGSAPLPGGAVGRKSTMTIHRPAAMVTTTRHGTRSNPSSRCCPCTGRGSRVATHVRCEVPGSAAHRRQTNSLHCEN